jgi:hypothetical protein
VKTAMMGCLRPASRGELRSKIHTLQQMFRQESASQTQSDPVHTDVLTIDPKVKASRMALQSRPVRVRQARAGVAIAAHFRLSAKTAAIAARGTNVAHEPITAVVVATAHRIETRCSIMPTSLDCE